MTKAIVFLCAVTIMMLLGACKSSSEYIPDFQAISFKDIQIQDIQDTDLQEFLGVLSKERSNWPEKETFYRMAEYDLNDDGTLELLIYMSGLGFGGSGGDPLYILEKSNGMYNIIINEILCFTVDIGPENPGSYRSIYFLIGDGGSRYYFEEYYKNGEYQSKEQIRIPGTKEAFKKYNIWYL